MHHHTHGSVPKPSVQVGPARKQPAKPAVHVNRLAKQTSPYLLLHQHNPVDWYPWGDEAFAKARAEDKPIFLSIGYSSCYWCHVMERESFSDAAIARFLNDHFVCIKVDREELPDVDEVYMTAIHLMGLRGGWPLSVFLTPEGRPFFGGTYWPPEDRPQMIGFPAVLERVAAAWRERRDEVQGFSSRLAEALHAAATPGPTDRDARLDRATVSRAVQGLQRQFDPQYGGFGYHPSQPHMPKFPQPPKVALLLYHARQADDGEALKTVTTTLDHMARGGIWDHVGGGFHRYSTDRFWEVPHFEKMLYDNALLARVYLQAFEATGDVEYRQVIEDTFAFVAREMTAPEGGFYSALDAESEHEEGKYYVWAEREVQEALGQDEYRLFAAVYGLDRPSNFEGDRYVVQRFEPLESSAARLGMSSADLRKRLQSIRSTLLQARDRRIRPLLDTKILTDWNGLMIAALADAYRVLGDDRYRQAAEAAATFLLDHVRAADGGLRHVYGAGRARIPGYLTDYAFLIDGLLALDGATESNRWLADARSLADQMIARFWDPASGGFFTTSAEHDVVLARLKSVEDSVIPSGNSLAVQTLVALAERTEDRSYANRAAQTLAAFRGAMITSPSEVPAMVEGLGRLLDLGGSVEATANQAESDGEPVIQAEAKLSVDPVQPGGQCRIDIAVRIADGWHVNAHPASADALVPLSVSFASPAEWENVRTEYPPGQPLAVEGFDESIAVYTGDVSIRIHATLAEHAQPADTTINLTIGYQACDARRCLAPQTVQLAVPISIAVPGQRPSP